MHVFILFLFFFLALLRFAYNGCIYLSAEHVLILFFLMLVCVRVQVNQTKKCTVHFYFMGENIFSVQNW